MKPNSMPTANNEAPVESYDDYKQAMGTSIEKDVVKLITKIENSSLTGVDKNLLKGGILARIAQTIKLS